MSEHGMSICDGRTQSAAVTYRSGHGAGAFRADTQRAAVVESRDGTASGAHGMNFKHGHGYGKFRYHVLAGGVQFSGEQGEIRGGATHIKADAFVEARQFGGVARADNTAGGAGEDGA